MRLNLLPLFKHFIFLFLLISFHGELKAQYVTIPDSVFATFLQKNYPDCMNGNQMDTTCKKITSATYLSLNTTGIKNLTGLQYFDTLVFFQDYEDSVLQWPPLPKTLRNVWFFFYKRDALPVLPAGIKSLRAERSNLKSLTSLPDSLTYFNCEYSMLTNLPALPKKLHSINCGYNLLSQLPALPQSLVSLQADHNQLTSLPSLTPNLTHISVRNNLLTTVPTLPAPLTELYVANNKLTALPVLPDSLHYLDCGHNQISKLPTLNPGLFQLNCWNNKISGNITGNLPQLTHLICDTNQITGIDIQAPVVYSVYCNHNQITRFKSLPPQVMFLQCSDNPIDSLPYLPASLLQLMCNNNQLTSIPTLPDQFQYLECRNNQLTSLPDFPSAAIGFSIDCSDNSITTLPAFTETMYFIACRNNKITCFPAFPNYCTSKYKDLKGNPFTCLPNRWSYMDSTLLAYPVCAANDAVNNPANCDFSAGVSGKIYKDLNSNCLHEYDENYLRFIPLVIRDSAGKMVSKSNNLFLNGLYNATLKQGRYTIGPDTSVYPFDLQCKTDSTFTIDSSHPYAQIDFGISCKGLDVGVRSIRASGSVFPGRQHYLGVKAGDMGRFYGLDCALGESGTLEIDVTGKLTYDTYSYNSVPPTSVSGKHFTYSLNDLSNLKSVFFGLLFTTDTNATSNDSVCVQVTITTSKKDINPDNNTKHFCYGIMNSFDPNFKEVYPLRLPANFSDWLTYTVHFQNTGTAPAYNIRLADTLDAQLDPETFQVTDASHPMRLSLNGRVANFMFKDIMLPDSHANEAGSHGFVQYRIKPKSALPLGSKVRNTAYIYFDYNDAVVTNTTLNEVVKHNSSASRQQLQSMIRTYPNPASGKVQIACEKYFSLSITDISGKQIGLYRNIKEVYLPPGVFLFEYTIEGTRIVEKVVVY